MVLSGSDERVEGSAADRGGARRDGSVERDHAHDEVARGVERDHAHDEVARGVQRDPAHNEVASEVAVKKNDAHDDTSHAVTKDGDSSVVNEGDGGPSRHDSPPKYVESALAHDDVACKVKDAIYDAIKALNKPSGGDDDAINKDFDGGDDDAINKDFCGGDDDAFNKDFGTGDDIRVKKEGNCGPCRDDSPPDHVQRDLAHDDVASKVAVKDDDCDDASKFAVKDDDGDDDASNAASNVLDKAGDIDDSAERDFAYDDAASKVAVKDAVGDDIVRNPGPSPRGGGNDDTSIGNEGEDDPPPSDDVVESRMSDSSSGMSLDDRSLIEMILSAYASVTDYTPCSSREEFISLVQGEATAYLDRGEDPVSLRKLVKSVSQRIGVNLKPRREFMRAIGVEACDQSNARVMMSWEDIDVDWAPAATFDGFMTLLRKHVDEFIMVGEDITTTRLYPFLCNKLGVDVRRRWVFVKPVVREVLQAYELQSPTEDFLSAPEANVREPEREATDDEYVYTGVDETKEEDEADQLARAGGDNVVVDSPDGRSSPASVDASSSRSSSPSSVSSQMARSQGDMTFNRMTKNNWVFDDTSEDSDYVESDVDMGGDGSKSKTYDASNYESAPVLPIDARMRLAAKWTPRSQEWKRLRQDANSPNNKLPQGFYHIDRVVDMKATDNGMEYMVVWADAPLSEKRSWIHESHFIHIGEFQDDIAMIMKWKQSGLSKRDFMRTSDDVRKWLYRRRTIGADGGKGWCAYNAVGTGLELLGVRNPITPDMIASFVAVGAKRRKVDPDKLMGVRLAALGVFVRQLRDVGVPIDMDAFKNRRKRGEVGLKGLAQLCSENGVYLVGGFPSGKIGFIGHCVILEVQDFRVDVYDEDELLDVRDLDWLHQLSFVCRLKLESPP